MINVKFKSLSEDALIPHQATTGSAGFDLYVPKDTLVKSGRNIVPLDFAIQLPEGYEAQIRPRSGFSAKGMEGVFPKGRKEHWRWNADVLIGTVDSDFTGNVGVIIRNDDFDFILEKGTRVAQMVFNKIENVEFELADHLEETERGTGGFNSTGSK